MDATPRETNWPFMYATGEEIKVGDRFHWGKNPALVEHLVAPDSAERENWHLPEGGVVFIISGNRMALTYDEEELGQFKFVMRASDDPERAWQREWKSPGMGRHHPDLWKSY
jgi:hypothetical protein